MISLSRRFRLGRRVVPGIAFQLGFPANKFYQMNRETIAEVGPTIYPRGWPHFAPDSPNLSPMILADPLLAARSALHRTWILETYNSTFQASDLSLHRINGGAVPMPDLSQVTWVGRERGGVPSGQVGEGGDGGA